MNIIDEELNKLNNTLLEALSTEENKISGDISEFIFTKAKRLRPKLIFLYAKALNININDDIINLACASELIHTSTLIHDDIIDNSDKRRGLITLNRKLGNNLSVLAGDFILSLAMQYLTKCNSLEVINIFAKALKVMCESEINQHFEHNIAPDFNEYILKSENKTAKLFEASLVSLCELKNLEYKKPTLNFAINFGIAFQLKDDYINIYSENKDKPKYSDIVNGIYTAPVLFLNQKVKVSSLSPNEIIEQTDNDEIKNQTIDLIKNYAKKAIASLEFIKDNQYKQELIKITENLYEAV